MLVPFPWGRQIVLMLRGVVRRSSTVPLLKRPSRTAASSLSSVCFGWELTRGRSVPTRCSPDGTLVRSTVKSSRCLCNGTQSTARYFFPSKMLWSTEVLGRSREGRSTLSFQQSCLLTDSDYGSFCRCVFFRLMSPLGDCKSECWWVFSSGAAWHPARRPMIRTASHNGFLDKTIRKQRKL